MSRRPKELTGIADAAAISLYEGSIADLKERGQETAAAREMLRCAAQWTQEAGELRRRIGKLKKEQDEDGKVAAKIRALMKNKAVCEGECRKILADLLLTPQRPRGRPAKPDTPDEGEDDGGWGAFDEGGGDT